MPCLSVMLCFYEYIYVTVCFDEMQLIATLLPSAIDELNTYIYTIHIVRDMSRMYGNGRAIFFSMISTPLESHKNMQTWQFFYPANRSNINNIIHNLTNYVHVCQGRYEKKKIPCEKVHLFLLQLNNCGGQMTLPYYESVFSNLKPIGMKRKCNSLHVSEVFTTH